MCGASGLRRNEGIARATSDGIAVVSTSAPRLHWNSVKGMRRVPPARIDVDPGALAAFCRRHHIRRLAFFGSVLHDDFRPDSDVDVLVEFEAGHTPGWEIFDIQDDLADLLGHEVDLGTFIGIRPHARDEILSSVQIQYEA